MWKEAWPGVSSAEKGTIEVQVHARKYGIREKRTPKKKTKRRSPRSRNPLPRRRQLNSKTEKVGSAEALVTPSEDLKKWSHLPEHKRRFQIVN